jgi:hypothetical protein
MSSIPPVPPGITLSAFGEQLWGTGPEAAKQRLAEITREELVQLGLTCGIARLWRNFYQQQAMRVRGLPTSAIRVQLLEKCLILLDCPDKIE